MPLLTNVDVRTRSIERFAAVLGEEEMDWVRRIGREMRTRLEGRVQWHVNTTAVGGGVAEMLRQHVSYGRGGGIDTRWLVISGGPEFFRITKRLHHALHGARGDGSPIGERERGVYEETLRQNAVELAARISPSDIVTLHDPQTAGLAPFLIQLGAIVVWRCHIGCDDQNDESDHGWDFVAPYLKDVPILIFTRESYVPKVLDRSRVRIVQPTIDAFSPKNWELDEDSIRTILVHIGLVEGPPPSNAPHTFKRSDGTPGRVERHADVVRAGRAPHWYTPLVVQVSRWDPLKDPAGVMQGFSSMLKRGAGDGAELVLAGPNVTGVTDDPEGGMVFEQVVSGWRKLPHSTRNRVHLACLPTADVEENAVMVNALQRHAAVVVQKSLTEGFGLTVTEAMWKGRPVIASGVGGIRDQIDDGVNGLMLKDPSDTDAFADLLARLLSDPEQAARLGAAAFEKARELFLDVRSFQLQEKIFRELEG